MECLGSHQPHPPKPPQTPESRSTLNAHTLTHSHTHTQTYTLKLCPPHQPTVLPPCLPTASYVPTAYLDFPQNSKPSPQPNPSKIPETNPPTHPPRPPISLRTHTHHPTETYRSIDFRSIASFVFFHVSFSPHLPRRDPHRTKPMADAFVPTRTRKEGR